jgi:hypothetical protein
MPETAQPADSPKATERLHPRLSSAVWGAAAIVAMIVCWRLAYREWMPTGDQARIWLSVTDIGGPNTPLVGAHSRAENSWFHPGPALQFYLWIFHAVLGGRFQAFLIGPFVAALAVAVALGLWLERLIGLRRTACFLVAYGLFCWGLGSRLLDPWNPLVLLCPLVLFVVACWALAMGRPRALPAACALGSFVVQCHLGLLPVTAALSVTAIGIYAFARRQQSPPAPLVKPLLATLGVFALFWALPLWEQLTRSPGNMTLIWQSFLGSESVDASTVGWERAAKIAAAHLLPWGPWLSERETPWIYLVKEADVDWLLLPLGALAFSAVRSRNQHDSATFRLTLLLISMVLATLFTLAQIRGAAYTYLALFTRVIVMFILCAVALTFVPRDVERPRSASAAPPLLRNCSIAALCIFVCAIALNRPLVAQSTARAYLQMAPAITASLPTGIRIRVSSRAPMFSGAEVENLAVIAKQTNEVDVSLEPASGSAKTPAADSDTAQLLITSGAEVMAQKQAGQGRLVAQFDSLTPSERREADTALATLMRQMREAGEESNFGRLDNPRSDSRAALPSSVSRPLLRRYQALTVGPKRLQLVVFLFQASKAA